MENELWKPKRFVWLNKLDGEAKAEEKTDAEKRAERAQAAFESFKGKSAPEAIRLIENADESYNNRIETILAETEGRFKNYFHNKAYNLFGGNKAKLDQAMTSAALSRIQGVSRELGMKEKLVGKHSLSSVALLTVKEELLGDLIGNLDKRLTIERQNLEDFESARKAVSVLSLNRYVWNNDLDVKIQQLQTTRDNANELQKEINEKTRGDLEKRTERVKQVGEYDTRVRRMILRNNPELAGALDQALRESLLVKGSMRPFNDFLKTVEKRGNTPQAQIDMCRQNVEYLLKGSRMSRFVAERWGIFSNRDVQDYYLKKMVDRGKLNRDTDTPKERVDRLKSFPLGQEVTISPEGSFYVVDNDLSRGVLLMNPDGTEAMIDTSDDVPYLTLKQGEKWVSKELKITQSETPSLTSIEFTTGTSLAEAVKITVNEKASSLSEKAKSAAETVKEKGGELLRPVFAAWERVKNRDQETAA